jgi:hypothetical protein
MKADHQTITETILAIEHRALELDPGLPPNG